MHKTTQTAPRGKRNRRSARRIKGQAQDPTSHPPPSHSTDLPEELWCKIFFHCLPTDEFICPSRTSAPLLLCQVCRTWRVYAIAMSELWASISIGSQYNADGRFPRPELIELWLSRGKTRPLSISYGRIPPDNELAELWDEDYVDAAETYDIFGLLTGHIARWKSLRLCPKELVEDSLPPIPQSGAPLLQHLRFVIPPGSVEYEYDFASCDLRLDDIWRCSTLLETFSLSADDIIIDDDLDSLCTSLHIRWHQLTTLIITACQTIKDCLEFLKECPNLVDCAFHSIFADDVILSTLYPPPILHTSLKSLLLRDSSFTSSDFLAEPFLANTTLPALRRLTFNAVEIFSQDSFGAFIDRSSCHIEDLTLYGVINETCLLQFLELLSHTLISLCIRHDYLGSSHVPRGLKWITDIIMHRLTRDEYFTSSAGTILCPKLESIDLDYRAVKARDGLFSTVVSSRFGVEKYGITGFKRVILRFHDEAVMDRREDVRVLKQLREGGVLGELRVEKIEGWR